MARELPYRTAASVEDMASFERVLSTCFAFAPEHAGPWIERLGLANVRLLGDADRPAPAALGIFEMGQWFGGKRVSCAGIAAVGVLPEHRGAGHARTLMSNLVHELHTRQIALSCLYPSTLSLYRSVGYAVAGARFEMRAGTASLIDARDTLRVVRLASVDDDALRACQSEAAARGNGQLARPPALWRRVADHRGEARDGYAVLDEHGHMRGYTWFARRATNESLWHDLAASDLVVLDLAAARTLGTFFHRHRTTARAVVWYGGADDPFFAAIPDVGAAQKLASPWMLRIVDVVRALEARGYAQGLQASVHLEIEDALIAENRGRFALSVADGAARVTSGGTGAVRLDITDLAAIYSAHSTAETRARFGRLRGPAGDVAVLSSLFAGAAPSMSDMF
ncbi:MAG: GNAT family N-acetyltransferase [Planctomycetes bacterium]|nr:GNAT family N-acetyltransferase [Planctomycetota bacterium]